MIRSFHTSATGMAAQQLVLDNTANPKKAFIRSTPYQNRLPTGNATLLQLYNGSTNPFTTSNTTQTAYSGSAATTAWDSASCK